MKFPSYIQHNKKDCGPTCLRIISKYYGKDIPLPFLRELCQVYREGTSLSNLIDATKNLGYNASVSKTSFEDLKVRIQRPCIIHTNQNHYVVLYKISDRYIFISDPAIGLIRYKKEDFLKLWLGDNNKRNQGIVIFLEPTHLFFDMNDLESNTNNRSMLKIIISYLIPYKLCFIEVAVSVIIACTLGTIMPYLTQAVVDKGVASKNVSLIILILIAQVMIVVGQTFANIMRNKLTLKISTNINISIVSDFLTKIMKLPVSFFEKTLVGDIIQRIKDCDRIQILFTNTIVAMFTSILSVVIYSSIIGNYNTKIFFVFIIGSIMYVTWILIFLKYREKLDYLRFQESSISQNNIVEMIDSIYEIKLNNIEREKIEEWKTIQKKLYHISQKRLNVAHIQEAGGIFIDQLKNVSISFLAAYSVVKGEMTLGMMMAVQYLMGQLNMPILQFVQFVQSLQDSKIALERMAEIHDECDEDLMIPNPCSEIPNNSDIKIENMSFSYPGSKRCVLSDINLIIPFGKTTAIVGASGSGKTTLLKLLLKLYQPTAGSIFCGDVDIKDINSTEWRKACSVVLQNGYIFSSSIRENISFNNEEDMNRIIGAAKIASINDFIESLPRKYDSIIGSDGIGLSAGQKQRLLIARAMYKGANYIFLDEATNSLDTKNEFDVVNNLNYYCQNKTLVVIAHRLSTVKDADQIVVLDSGKVAEIGTHTSLVENRGIYYNLIHNQIQLN